MLGWKDEEARRVIERWGEKRIVLRYPKHFPALDRQIREVPEILKRLTGQDWDLTHDARHNRLVYTPHVEVVMPERVSYKWSAEDPADLIPIGRDERNEPVLADLTGLTPHVLVSAPTGFGKTTILSVIVYGDMKRILWLGRAAGYHVIGAAQQANVKAVFGASDPRDQFALRIASGPQSPEAWAFMFGKQPVPNLPARRGLASVGVGTAFRTVQLAHLSTAEARAIAARGKARFSTSPVGDTAHVDHVEPLDKVEIPGDVGPDDVEPTLPTLTLIKPPMINETIRPARAPLKPQEGPGRPADRPAVELECGKCGNVWSTRARPGTKSRCTKCKVSRRVPVGAGTG
jgi:hypothetical protein